MAKKFLLLGTVLITTITLGWILTARQDDSESSSLSLARFQQLHSSSKRLENKLAATHQRAQKIEECVAQLWKRELTLSEAADKLLTSFGDQREWMRQLKSYYPNANTEKQRVMQHLLAHLQSQLQYGSVPRSHQSILDDLKREQRQLRANALKHCSKKVSR